MTDFERYLSCARQVAAGFVPDDRGALLEAVEELEQVTKERDAAVRDIYKAVADDDAGCQFCTEYGIECPPEGNCTVCKKKCRCKDCNGVNRFMWRGVCDENGGAEDVDKR